MNISLRISNCQSIITARAVTRTASVYVTFGNENLMGAYLVSGAVPLHKVDVAFCYTLDPVTSCNVTLSSHAMIENHF